MISEFIKSATKSQKIFLSIFWILFSLAIFYNLRYLKVASDGDLEHGIRSYYLLITLSLFLLYTFYSIALLFLENLTKERHLLVRAFLFKIIMLFMALITIPLVILPLDLIHPYGKVRLSEADKVGCNESAPYQNCKNLLDISLRENKAFLAQEIVQRICRFHTGHCNEDQQLLLNQLDLIKKIDR